MSRSTFPRLLAGLIALPLLAAIAGCSSAPPEPERMATVRQQIQQARADANISRYAAIPLHEAEQSFAAAEAASKAGNATQTDHQLYVTEQRLEIARSRASAQAAAAERQALAQERSDIQLQSAEQRASRLEQELAELRSRPTPQGTAYTLTEGFFETGKAQLKAGAVNRLQPLVSYLKGNPDKSVIIEGHTDSTGSAATNERLSLERAQAVRDYLVGEGVEPGRIAARGMGEQFPVASNDTPSGRQQNRRVEVLISEVR